MASDPGTPAQFKAAKATAIQIGKIRAAFDPKWKDVTTKLRAAIKEKQADKIDLYLSALDGQIKALNKALRAATLARGNLREIELDEDFVADNLKEVEAALTIVSDAVTSFTRQYDEGKTLQNEAEKAGARFSGGADQAMSTCPGSRRRRTSTRTSSRRSSRSRMGSTPAPPRPPSRTTRRGSRRRRRSTPGSASTSPSRCTTATSSACASSAPTPRRTTSTRRS